MNISPIQPQEALRPYIQAFWLFESPVGIPLSESGILVPNGRARIVLPYQNSLTVIANQKPVTSKEQDLLLAGLWDVPTTLSSSAEATGTIGIDLSPKGLYHFFHLNMGEITNRIVPFAELFGGWGARIQSILGNLQTPSEKVAYLEIVLLDLLRQNTKDFSLLDFAIDRLIESEGMVAIQALEAQTGYTKRYLDLLFKEHVGISPKRLATILRFHKAYKRWAQTPSPTTFTEEFNASYYDQSHYIHEFKRFTGYPPQKYSERTNEMSRTFYMRVYVPGCE
jgi:AraC-like DNA-binding protein